MTKEPTVPAKMRIIVCTIMLGTAVVHAADDDPYAEDRKALTDFLARATAK